ncbi:MAG: aminopeptidase N, partial [Deltaproteobacteria bacterium]|nr:aminopeptidase N [Deltaproteobacteria bacterium]
MAKEKPTTTFRKDYSAPYYFIESVELLFKLFDEKTRVITKSIFYKNDHGMPTGAPLILSGEKLNLISVKMDGKPVDPEKYSADNKTLTINNPPSTFTLEIITEIDPARNTSLEGLYRSSGNYCTQCEAEGFRKITYYLDRPDILAKFTVRIEGDKESCPVMLSNGNCIERGELDANRHYAIWQDPFPKPCYLFALVAGRLVSLEDEFITRSGKKIDLKIYVEERNRKKCGYAMLSLKKAMKWDEDVFGLEYDLNTYMIVAVDDFNMGAME